VRNGGCFTGNSTVRVESGERRRLSELEVGEKVLAEEGGKLVYSEVLMFLDREERERRRFLRVMTSSGAEVKLTPSHLIMRRVGTGTEAVFAGRLSPGDTLLVRREGSLVEDAVLSIVSLEEEGVFAPLTRSGTLLVDDVLASCYAVIESQSIAHAVFAPIRLYDNAAEALLRFYRLISRPLSSWSGQTLRSKHVHTQIGIHWYPDLFYKFYRNVFGSVLLYEGS
jgi:hedgehog protein